MCQASGLFEGRCLAHAVSQTMSTLHSSHRRALVLVEAILLFAALGLFVLHYLHLSADFPNYSPWMDWSKYTDEGWYGDAAIRELQRGSWRVPGSRLGRSLFRSSD
jgi:hypothetical protein